MIATVREFAPAKINLALHVLGRRADGYHEINSVVAFADVGDALELRLAAQTGLTVVGPFAAEVPVNSHNLVLKAHAAISTLVAVPAIEMKLTKNLPVASGIGGGSADAAAALRGIARLAELQINAETMQRLALTLGADVPVCMHGEACRMQGVGEIITPVQHLPAMAIVLANPLVACGTAEVFRAIGLKAGDSFRSELDIAATSAWRNDMTEAAQRVLPAISQVLSALETLPNAQAVRMSGSGATCFALFHEFEQAQSAAMRLAALHPDWWVAPGRLS